MYLDHFNLKAISSFLDEFNDINNINKYLEQKTGIIDFFRSRNEFLKFKIKLTKFKYKQSNKELGDFQTPIGLTDKICKFILKKGYNPEIILEPTAGTGNFIISAIKFFPKLKFIYAIEKQYKHEFIFKLRMLKLSRETPINCKIEYHNDDIFTHTYSNVFKEEIINKNSNFLILGNPPWITNTELSLLKSNNLPKKSNIKNFKGIDALTGKSNFDISEYIIMNLIIL